MMTLKILIALFVCGVLWLFRQSAVTATLTSSISVIESPDDTSFASPASKHTIAGLAKTISLTASSSPTTATDQAFDALALTAGAATIDLRDLTKLYDAPVDGNGKKVVAIIFRAKSTNANPIKITVGASNGYEIAGADFTCTLKAGQRCMLDLLGGAPTIGGSAKTLDITGTGSQVLEYHLVLGA